MTTEDHLAKEEVVVVLVDTFGLCWRIDLCQSGLEDPFFHDNDDDERAPVNPYLNYGSSKCGFFIFS
jgi:hypothetical protein